uniref:Globin n=1 Tax=Arion vulgaris TaxID=1028688 RepID=A0A0B6Z5X9_9EUPU
MKVLETVVEHMDEPEVIQPHLVALGARHATVEGYHTEYFRFYSKCLLEVWEMELGEEFIAEVRDSWKYMIDYIVRCMIQGYDISLTNQLDIFMKGDNFITLEQT